MCTNFEFSRCSFEMLILLCNLSGDRFRYPTKYQSLWHQWYEYVHHDFQADIRASSKKTSIHGDRVVQAMVVHFNNQCRNNMFQYIIGMATTFNLLIAENCVNYHQKHNWKEFMSNWHIWYKDVNWRKLCKSFFTKFGIFVYSWRVNQIPYKISIYGSMIKYLP